MRIISPWTIYWISRLDDIRVAIVVAAGALVIAAFTVAMINDINCTHAPKGKIKKLLIAAAIVSMLELVVPSTRTAIEMVIADKVTYEAADEALERIGEVADHIIGEIKEEE
jgi:NADH:ubiquinone oxidoreductase subunit 6 (subunit J)